MQDLEFSVASYRKRPGAPVSAAAVQHRRIPFSKPSLITTYTLTPDRRILIPGEAPLFRQFPAAGSDLSEGYPERYYPKFEVKGIDPIIEVLRRTYRLSTEQPSTAPSSSSSSSGTTASSTVGNEREFLPLPKRVDFVSFRNNFNKIMGTPYASWRDEWMIELHRVEGTVFMNVRRTPGELLHFEKEHVVHNEEMRKRGQNLERTTVEEGDTKENDDTPSVGQKRKIEDIAKNTPTEEADGEDHKSDAKRARMVTIVRSDDHVMSPEEYDSHFREKQRELISGMENSDVTPNEAHQIKQMYRGYRFESLCSADPNDLAHLRVNPNEEFCGMYTCKLGHHRLILCAELDCVDENRILPGSKEAPPSVEGKVNQDLLVEVKTHRIFSSDRNKTSFEKYKLLKTYIQSFLVATPKIVFGYRDDEGKIKACQVFDTLKIPRMTSAHWDPWRCLDFTNALLSFISANTSDDKRYLVRFNGGDNITLEESKEIHFLPQEFVDEWKRRPKV